MLPMYTSNSGQSGRREAVLVKVADASHLSVLRRISPRHDLPPCLADACRVYLQVLPSHCVLAMSSHVMTYLRVLLKLTC
jgi:hypothetical protein